MDLSDWGLIELKEIRGSKQDLADIKRLEENLGREGT